jgi:hypothetical protein
MKRLSIVLLTSLVLAGPAGAGVRGDEYFTLVKQDKVVSLYERWITYIRTRVTYIVSTRRSSKVPRWISDPLVRNNLFETMTAFKNTLEK